jgi:hypothetical protein
VLSAAVLLLLLLPAPPPLPKMGVQMMAVFG